LLTFLKYNLWAILWGLFIVVLTILPGSYMPKLPQLVDLLQPDKLIHLLVFCVYFILQRRSFIRQPVFPWVSRNALGITLLICFSLAAGTELIQHYAIPLRRGSVYDFIANLAGCLPGYYLSNSGRGSSGR
jgi:VanZ family protein